MVHIARRKFIIAMSGAALAWPIEAWPQGAAKGLRRIGWLSGSQSIVASSFADHFLDGMRGFGYVDGRDFEFVPRYAEGFQDRLPGLAQEIIALKPAVIIAAAVNAAVPAHAATKKIPIVCPALADAVNLGLIASEARPSGNVTGIEPYIAGLPAKQIEVVREIAPGAKRIGLLANPGDPKAPPQRQELRQAAKALEMTIVEADANSPGEIGPAIEALASSPVDVMIVLQTGLFLGAGQQIAKLATAKRLPTVYGYREHVLAGGLISYGVDLRWCYRRAAHFVDKILKGTPPGELPVEFPSKMMLSVNLKAAKELGVAIPQALLSFVDEVIE